MKKQFACALVGVLAGVNAFAAEMKVGGFVDAQYQWTNTVNTGFRIGDSAVRFSAEGKEAGFKLAVPLTFSTSGANTTLLLGTLSTRGEAYAAYKYSNGFNWKLGQFDSMYGVERNFLDQNRAASFGLLRSATYQPLTFMGLALGYKSGSFEATLLGADARNTSTIGAAGSPDFGVQLGYVADSMWAKAGFLYNSAAATGYLIDLVLGAKMGALKADLGFQMANPATVSTLGFLIQPAYAINDMIDASVRVEFLSATGTSTLQATAGPAFNMSKELKVRPEYTFTSATVSGTSTTSHAALLSAQYSL